jgi:hypothetical protein
MAYAASLLLSSHVIPSLKIKTPKAVSRLGAIREFVFPNSHDSLFVARERFPRESTDQADQPRHCEAPLAPKQSRNQSLRLWIASLRSQ